MEAVRNPRLPTHPQLHSEARDDTRPCFQNTEPLMCSFIRKVTTWRSLTDRQPRPYRNPATLSVDLPQPRAPVIIFRSHSGTYKYKKPETEEARSLPDR